MGPHNKKCPKRWGGGGSNPYPIKNTWQKINLDVLERKNLNEKLSANRIRGGAEGSCIADTFVDYASFFMWPLWFLVIFFNSINIKYINREIFIGLKIIFQVEDWGIFYMISIYLLHLTKKSAKMFRLSGW